MQELTARVDHLGRVVKEIMAELCTKAVELETELEHRCHQHCSEYHSDLTDAAQEMEVDCSA